MSNHKPIKCNYCNGSGEHKQEFIRSLNQNAYYRVVLIMIASEIGEPEERCHDLMKYMFNSNKEYFSDSLKGVTTTKLITKRFEIYIRKIKDWAFNYLNMYIPDARKLSSNDLKGISREYESMFF